MKTRVITLSAISAAFVAICLTIGVYFQIVDIFAIILSSVFVLLPLYYKSYLGCFLAALAGGVLAFLCGGLNIFSIVFPTYFGFFAFFPIVSWIMREKKLNIALQIVIGLLWCVAVFYGTYFFYIYVLKLTFNDLPAWVTNNIFIIIGVLGVVFYFVYERFIFVVKLFLDKLLKRIIK